jgi:hypothetical protein
MAEMARVLKKKGLLCIIAPNGFGEHRHPVDCYRFFTDGMVALARYVCMDILHAHTNCAPSVIHHEWLSTEEADSILIAQKNYVGGARFVELDSYQCIPSNQEMIRSGLFPGKPRKRVLLNTFKKIKRFTIKK